MSCVIGQDLPSVAALARSILSSAQLRELAHSATLTKPDWVGVSVAFEADHNATGHCVAHGHVGYIYTTDGDWKALDLPDEWSAELSAGWLAVKREV